jgi:hypothetical protein
MNTPQATRALTVRQALTRRAHRAYSTTELQVLTQYVLGYLTLEQTNTELRTLGLTLCLAPATPQPA